MTQTPPGWARPLGFDAPRPGCVPLRPLGLGDILDGSFRILRRNPRATLGLSALVTVIQVAVTTLLTANSLSRLGQLDVTGSSNPNATSGLGAVLGGEFATVLGYALRALLGAVLTGMLVLVVTQDVLGVRLSVPQVWARTRRRALPLLALAILLTLVEFLALLPCLVLGIWLWGIWAVAVPAFMVESSTIRGALGRSKELVSGTFWRVWGIRALGWLIVSVVSSIVVLPFEVLGFALSGSGFDRLIHGGGLPTLVLVTAAVGQVIAGTVTAPVLASIDSLLYVDLRMRKEGLDLVLQQATLRPVG